MYVTLDLACEVRLERGGGQVHFFIPTREPWMEQEGVPGVWLHRHRSPHPVLPTPSDTCSHMQLSGVPPPSPWLGSMAFSTTPAFSHPRRHADTAGESPVSRLLTTSDARHQNPRHLPMLLPITDMHVPAHSRTNICSLSKTTCSRWRDSPSAPSLLWCAEKEPTGLPATPGSTRRPAQSPRASPSPAPHTDHHSLAAGLAQEVPRPPLCLTGC